MLEDVVVGVLLLEAGVQPVSNASVSVSALLIIQPHSLTSL